MGDVRELARECVSLWDMTSPIGGRINQWWAVHRSLDSIRVYGTDEYSRKVGAIRHAVEVEAERRGQPSLRWERERGGKWAFTAPSATRVGHPEDKDVQCHSQGDTALECALLALKWLLENPAGASASVVSDGTDSEAASLLAGSSLT
jgi:hypothetical protein